MFSKKVGKILGFLTAYKLFMRMRMRDNSVKEQIQWVLSYMQGGSVDMWKKRMSWRI